MGYNELLFFCIKTTKHLIILFLDSLFTLQEKNHPRRLCLTLVNKINFYINDFSSKILLFWGNFKKFLLICFLEIKFYANCDIIYFTTVLNFNLTMIILVAYLVDLPLDYISLLLMYGLPSAVRKRPLLC